MKRTFIAILLIVACAFTAGCGEKEEVVSSNDALIPIRVGATPVPHSEILEVAKEILKDRGYELEIVEFTDYVQPNLALDSGELDANFFQHVPYLDEFNDSHGLNLISVGAIHYEPFGLFPGRTKSLEDLANGASIAVPNDTTNEARALLLLESLGYITLSPGVGLVATVADIVSNPKGLKIVELEAAQIPRSLADVDLAVINGNYAIQAGLNALTDALAIEDKDSLAASTFANIVAVRNGNQGNDVITALLDALYSDEVRKFVEDTYQGAVVVVF
jgi:ABC-type metal ion transport system, periplasmic component/surface antigen